MPQAIAFAALVVSSYATTVIGANLLYLGTLAAAYAALGFGLQALQGLFIDKPSVPKPEDGNYNLKQSVPSLSYVLGRTKKASDYLFLEEKEAVAYHILCGAGHRIQGYVQHYLHDEAVTLDVSGFVLTPTHFAGNFVQILTRSGLNAETAYANIVTKFPEIWSNDHRGDGLATVMMSCVTADQEDQLSVYTNQMPQHSAVIDGALVYDPREPSHDPEDENTWEFAQNLALLRLWHLTHPVGGKLNISDMYIPEWINAANVCDQTVINKQGESVPRYHGGMWFRANSNPIEVGRLFDQAAELVVYERPDGLVGVHAGEYVVPDIRLTGDDIISLSYDANQSEETTVLAVRGRFTSPENTYNTVDAAIIGDPYVGEDTERTKTVDNQAVQSHNHIQRLQNITFERANAPRVSLIAHYEPAEDVDSRRFVTVHYPPQMVESTVEITSTPTISLSNMTVEFSGIIVPATLYNFNAATQEGDPPTTPEDVVATGVPTPTGFAISIQTQKLTGGNTACFAVATWTIVSGSEKLRYEFEWQPTSGANQSKQSAMQQQGDANIRSGYLLDGVPHRFRLRTWSGPKHSDWTTYITATPYADAVAPLALSSFSIVGSAPHMGNAQFSMVTKNDSHVRGIQIFRKPSGVPLDLNVDTPIGTQAAVASSTYGFIDGDATTVAVINEDFSTAGSWSLGTGWTIGSGVASHVAGTSSNLGLAYPSFGTDTWRIGFNVVTITAGGVRPRLTGGTTVSPAYHTTVGYKLNALVASGSNTQFSIGCDSLFAGSVDNITVYKQTAGCAPAGVWDYYAVPINGSDRPGPVSGPVTVTVI